MKLNTAKEAFSEQSSEFDEIYSKNIITNYGRQRIRTLLDKFLDPNSEILELNGGTGEDAIYLAKQGHTVHSTDISDDMIGIMNTKIQKENLSKQITTRQLDYHQLEQLDGHKYDLIYSNFGGLNCTKNLDQVLETMPSLLKTNGKICLVVMPSTSLWELLIALKGNFKLAFRRLKKNGTPSHITGKHFLSWYYSPSFIKNQLKESCKTLAIEALCVCVPPVYYERHISSRPGLFRFFKGCENLLKAKRPFRSLGDYFIIILEKK